MLYIFELYYLLPVRPGRIWVFRKEDMEDPTAPVLPAWIRKNGFKRGKHPSSHAKL